MYQDVYIHCQKRPSTQAKETKKDIYKVYISGMYEDLYEVFMYEDIYKVAVSWLYIKYY
jgi:hypothetical protein